MTPSRQNNSRIPTRSVALRQLAARVVRRAAKIVDSAGNLALLREVWPLQGAEEAAPHDFPIAGETALKCDARAHDLHVRRPDCGTAIVNGIPRGFCNGMRRGSIGAIA